ncbi:complement component receptor 1-like protein [Ictalurus furcatus]|uniref:complement component receptor 1-like protein n=1 Tax=Ictalurus furcatus TaxID=66913 RepID=UPI002350A8CD|nr:complement component receptor 1-like protein [Ictalurus furcatus]
MLRYMIICSTLLMTAVTVQAQCERPDVGENRILTEDHQTFPDGSTVKFKCSTGYIPVESSASRSITCTGTQWSDLELQCKKRPCGSPGEITNGKYIYQPTDGISFGATITAECNEGYMLVGTQTRNCRENGWDGRAPICEVTKCPKPTGITDGTFEPEDDSYDYGEAVTYYCNRGLDLIGLPVSTCSSNGTFQPSPPRCLRVSCERPEIPNSVRIEGKSPPYKYKNFVRYQCNKGYRMNGSDYLTCKEDGWNPPPPQCNVITCLKPPDIKNGTFNPQKELYEYGETVTWSCNQGFRLGGASTISCTDDGTFETSPQCLDITCDSPSVPNAVISGSSPYRYGVSVQISCNQGYRIEGSNKLTCAENGWTPSLPRCIDITCDSPSVPNAVISGSSPYRYGVSVQISCNQGYRIEGSNKLTCAENGWTPSLPRCIDITCDSPSVPNAVISGSSPYRYGVSVQISCNQGYRIEGSNKLTCAENGWTPPPPKCNNVICDRPQIEHGYIDSTAEYFVYKSSVRVHCNQIYKMEGSENLTCEENGWNPPPPQCHLNVICDRPQIEHGYIDSTEKYFVYKSSVRVHCNKIYNMEGSDYLTCGENGWNPPPPQCHLSTYIWIILILIGLLVLGCVIFYRFKKNRKSKEPKVRSKPENCSLVNVSFINHTTEESSPKGMY